MGSKPTRLAKNNSSVVGYTPAVLVYTLDEGIIIAESACLRVRRNLTRVGEEKKGEIKMQRTSRSGKEGE